MSGVQRKHISAEPQEINSIEKYPDAKGICAYFRSRNEAELGPYLEGQFYHFLKKWIEETGHQSSTSQIKNNQNYKALVQLGWPAIPLVLREIKSGNSEVMWAFLLADIVGYNPVPPELFGNFDLMHGYWVKWAEDKKFFI